MITRLKTLLAAASYTTRNYMANFVEGPAVRSAKTVSNSIFTDFAATRVADGGCRTGALLEAFAWPRIRSIPL
jgi:hypothetical protein